jgi:16S rRNA (cytosine1402-N4)-methyltransferase
VQAGWAEEMAGCHLSVMTREVMEFLAVKQGLYVDATIGSGGHSALMLQELRQGVLVGIDQDPDAIARTHERLGQDPRLRLFHANFAQLGQVLNQVPEACTGLAGIIFDLGVARFQVAEPGHGLSYSVREPLDMRLDPTSTGPTAIELIRRGSEKEIGRIIREYGEERFFRRISARIVKLRSRLLTTADLADAVRAVVPFRFQAKAVMRTFQALRIAVNNELENLRAGLEQALSRLAVEGRIVVLSYHSLEDRIVKQMFRAAAVAGQVRILTRRPLRPGDAEVAENPSARSARLRAAVRLPAGSTVGLAADERRPRRQAST